LSPPSADVRDGHGPVDVALRRPKAAVMRTDVSGTARIG
jgi:hypothetical protein